MKKAIKEANESGVSDKLRAIGHVFINKREISLHGSILRLLSSPFRRSNTDVIFIPTGPKEQCTRVMKSKAILDLINDDDADVFVIGLIENMLIDPIPYKISAWHILLKIIGIKVQKNADVKEDDTIEGYMIPVAGYNFMN